MKLDTLVRGFRGADTCVCRVETHLDAFVGLISTGRASRRVSMRQTQVSAPQVVLVFVALCGVLTLGCQLRPAKAAVKPAVATPRPATPPTSRAETASDLPVSVPQTQVTLPSPQPIEAAALATILPDTPPEPGPPNPTVRPPRTPARAERPATVALPPATVAPPPAPAPTPPPSRRLRPVESPAERQRLMAGITARQREVQGVLAKAKNRQLSEKDKNAVERIQSFLEQTETALKDEDFQQAEALSSRALLLSQDLSGDK